MLARSASHGKAGGEQSYCAHIAGTMRNVREYLILWRPFLEESVYQRVKARLMMAAWLHDWGKLDPQNQMALQQDAGRRRLPVPHQYAGAWYLYHVETDPYTAALISGHHAPGLPDLNAQIADRVPFGERFVRTDADGEALKRDTKEKFPLYWQRHLDAMGAEWIPSGCGQIAPPQSALELRVEVACLSAADRGDARRWGEGKEKEEKRQSAAREEQEAERAAEWEKMTEQLSGYLRRERKREEEIRFVEDHFGEEAGEQNISPRLYVWENDPAQTDRLLRLLWGLRCAARRNATQLFVILPSQRAVTKIRRDLEGIFPTLQAESTVLCAGDVTPASGDSTVGSPLDTSVGNLNMMIPGGGGRSAGEKAAIRLTTAKEFYRVLPANRLLYSRGREGFALCELPGSVLLLEEFQETVSIAALPLVWEWLALLQRDWGCAVLCSSGITARFWETSLFRRQYEGKRP
ncbi:MAG: hypothetical protein Q4C60_11785 [Eubacteriales bacterium]|nr:hypothetical protein [Eubacteriales bacterium]